MGDSAAGELGTVGDERGIWTITDIRGGGATTFRHTTTTFLLAKAVPRGSRNRRKELSASRANGYGALVPQTDSQTSRSFFETPDKDPLFRRIRSGMRKPLPAGLKQRPPERLLTGILAGCAYRAAPATTRLLHMLSRPNHGLPTAMGMQVRFIQRFVGPDRPACVSEISWLGVRTRNTG